MLVTLADDDPTPDDAAIGALQSDPCLVVVRADRAGGDIPDRWRALADAIVEDDETQSLIGATADHHPRATVALALLMRGAERRSLADGLVAESVTYSVLQSGPEFEAWRAHRLVKHRVPPDGPVVLVDRDGDVLTITLNRPDVRNALDTRLRDELLEALAIAQLDQSIARVVMRGAGRSYSAGGDLDEFGSFPDPATAHLIRLQRSVGRVVASMADRVEVHVHGGCYGSGVEIPAFAGTVVATPDARFALPELALGLIPGAGGTVSITNRIGRHRTTALMLTGHAIDATTALAWGLVDAIEQSPGP